MVWRLINHFRTLSYINMTATWTNTNAALTVRPHLKTLNFFTEINKKKTITELIFISLIHEWISTAKLFIITILQINFWIQSKFTAQYAFLTIFTFES